MPKKNKPDYLAKAKLLTKDETERLLSRMGGKLDRRLEKNKLSQEEALAIQLQLEDEQLQEWRKVMLSLKKKEEAKEAKKDAMKEAKAAAKKAPAPAKTRAATKTKTTAKAPAKSKPKTKTKTKTKTGSRK